MWKKEVIDHFGGVGGGGIVNTANALGISKAAVCQFPDLIPITQSLTLEVITKGKLKFDKKPYQEEALKNYKGNANLK